MIMNDELSRIWNVVVVVVVYFSGYPRFSWRGWWISQYISGSTAVILIKIQTRYLPNAKQEC